jgi:hypothetical protein
MNEEFHMSQTNTRPDSPAGRRTATRRQEQAARARKRAALYGSGAIVVVLVIAGLIWYGSRPQSMAPVAGQPADLSTLACPDLQQPILDLYRTLPKSTLARQVKLIASPYGKPLPAPGPEVALPDEGNAHVTDAVIPYKHIPPASGPHYEQPAAYQFNTGEVPEGNWIHSLEHGAIVLLYQCDTGRTTAIAWNHQLPMQGVDVAQITAFYNRYVDKGPERAP